jgi:hypothetical protein
MLFAAMALRAQDMSASGSSDRSYSCSYMGRYA